MVTFITVALLWGTFPVSSRELTVSLITCAPGGEIYELCGHSAIRVRGEGIDSVWNYGLFNFNEPNFVYRFVKGETDYMVAGYPFKWFLPEYVRDGREVVEQDLNLTPGEAETILERLRAASLPENSRYRYNYIKDNCSTRIITQIDSGAGERVIYPDTIAYGTFRNEMRAFHEGYPWYQFGIDLALGSGLDYRLSPREEMFVPVVLRQRAAGAHLADGRPLVKEERILNPGTGMAVLPPTPWWQGPLLWSWVCAAIAVWFCIYAFICRHIPRFFYFLWFFIIGMGGILVCFLVFVSVHAATSPNALIFWLNPLQLLMCVGVCSRRLRVLGLVMGWYNAVAITILLIVWPFISQSANPGFFPLMGATAMLGATYAIIARKSSYNNDRKAQKHNGAKKKNKRS